MLESFANMKEYINTTKTHTFLHISLTISVCKSKQENTCNTIKVSCFSVPVMNFMLVQMIINHFFNTQFYLQRAYIKLNNIVEFLTSLRYVDITL